jgi:tetratricopeptide (TPR) repeat protein
LIDSLRVANSDPSLFALEKGSVLESRKQYAEAAREYLPILHEDTTQGALEAEKRLLALLEFEGSSEEVEAALISAADEPARVRVLSILSSYYVKSGRFDEAYEFCIRQDTLDETDGQALLYFIQQCRERALYDQVARMCQYVFSAYDQEPFLLTANFQYAEALAETGRTDEAIAAYSGIVSDYEHVGDKAEALYRIGEIYLNYLNNYQAALDYFDSVVTHYQHGLGYLSSMLSIPHCYLRMGDLERARERFDLLLHRHLNDDTREEVQYYTALLDFFEHRYDSAEVAFRKLIVDYPRGFYVNDALQLVMLITEAKSAPELLGKYADALQFQERAMPDSALERLEEVAGAERKVLADVALFKLASLELSLTDSTQALLFVERLAEEFPGSYFLPYGLKIKADILRQRIDGIEEAKSVYRNLLQNYPNYPFISEVRKILRQLETDARIG